MGSPAQFTKQGSDNIALIHYPNRRTDNKAEVGLPLTILFLKKLVICRRTTILVGGGPPQVYEQNQYQ